MRHRPSTALIRLAAVCLVNESAAAERDEAAEAVFHAFEYLANEAGDKMVQLAPFGDFPNAGGYQRFRPEDAQKVVDDFDDPLNLEARGLGLPWYVGHPDFEKLQAKYTDHAAKGRIKKLAVKHDLACEKCKAADLDDPCREHGLFAKVKWNSEGKKIIGDESFHGHSVNWRVHRDDKGFARPFSLKSVGFTNDPQIPVPAITTANENMNTTLDSIVAWIKKLTGKDITAATPNLVNELDDWMANTFEPMKKKSGDCAANETAVTNARALLKDLNLTFPTDQPVVIFLANEVLGSRTRETTLVNEKRDLTSTTAAAATEAANKLTEMTRLRDTAVTDLGTANATIANERTGRAKLLGKLGVAEGRLSAAQEEVFVNEVKADPAAGETRLAGMAKVWNPGASRVGNLGERSTEAIANENTRRAKVQELVNERMKKDKIPYEQAYAKTEAENPALFGEMAQDALKQRRAKK